MMERISIIVVAVFITVGLFAQSPEKMNYQAVVRNSSNQLVVDQEISLRISILQGTDQSNNVYSERQTPTTNTNGLFSVEIGTGTTSDSFSQIDWSTGPYFISTEIDLAGGTNYTILGTNQLLSVPYALYAKKAENVFSGDYKDLANTPTQATKLSELTNDVGYITTEKQSLSQVLTESNDGGAIQIKNIADPLDDQDVATKNYVTLKVSKYGDTLFLGANQWIVLPGISKANSEGDDTVIDSDGNEYSYVTIGTQVWLTEDLKVTSLNDGTEIPHIQDGAEWANLSTPGYSYYQGVSPSAPVYNWFTVNTNKLCPAGWHVPSLTELETLIEFLGGPSVAGGKLKESNILHWNEPNAWATNESGFTAFGGGYRLSGFFYNWKEYGSWWSSTENDNQNPSTLVLNYFQFNAGFGTGAKSDGRYVRCVLD